MLRTFASSAIVPRLSQCPVIAVCNDDRLPVHPSNSLMPMSARTSWVSLMLKCLVNTRRKRLMQRVSMSCVSSTCNRFTSSIRFEICTITRVSVSVCSSTNTAVSVFILSSIPLRASFSFFVILEHIRMVVVFFCVWCSIYTN